MSFWVTFIAFAAATVLVYVALSINGVTAHGGGHDDHSSHDDHSGHGHDDHAQGAGHGGH